MENPLLGELSKLLALLERIAVALEGSTMPARQASGTPVSVPCATAPVVSAPAAPAPAFMYEEVKRAVFAYQDKHGQPAAIALLKDFGARYLSELKPEQYAAVMAKVS